jgi:Leucine rich repeat
VLSEVEVPADIQDVVFGGIHMSGRTNDDVEVVLIQNSNTPAIFPQIFTTFVNVIELEMIRCNLLSLKIPANARLEFVLLYGNNVTHIRRGDFSNQTNLLYLEAINNNIQIIDENAFDDLERLLNLILFNNNLRELAPKTFHRLTSLIYLDLEGNELTRIDDELLAKSLQLQNIYLEFNHINEISRRFADNLRQNLELINLIANKCVDKAFVLVNEASWRDMNRDLEKCFDNYDNANLRARRITLEFTGRLRILDESGNVVADI